MMMILKRVLIAIAAIIKDKQDHTQMPCHALVSEISQLTKIAFRDVQTAGYYLQRYAGVQSGYTINNIYYLINQTKVQLIMNEFEKVIFDYLQEKSGQEPAFSAKFEAKGGKDCVPDCCKYIIAEVAKTHRNGFADDEIYSMATHYIDEDLKAPKTIPDGRIIINKEVELTEEEKAKLDKKAKKMAEDKYLAEAQRKIESDRAKKEAAEKKKIKERNEALKKAEQESNLFSFLEEGF